MASAATQACRPVRRDVREELDEVMGLLFTLGERAAEVENDSAVALCDEALDLVERTLDDDGSPGPGTGDAIANVLAGPLARAERLLAATDAPPLTLVR
jgi:hypothetical protein